MIREAIAADPEDAQRYLLLADFYKNKFGTEKAIAELESSSKAKPELTTLQFSLAQLYLQSEQFDKAETIYQGIIDKQGLEPDGLTARTGLAALRVQQGEISQAQTLLQEVLTENPKDSKALLLRITQIA